MTYLPKTQEQMNGDLLVPEATKLFLHRVMHDLQDHLDGAPPTGTERAGLAALREALGACFEPLPSVREMLDLPDEAQEQRGRNLLRVNLPR
jgi:hypothetical protein